MKKNNSFIKKLNQLILVIGSIIICLTGISQVKIDFHSPPVIASVFSEGIISTGLNERDMTFSPSGDEIFYTIQSSRFVKSTIIQIKKINNQWQKPGIASFSGKYKDLEAFFSPDGNTVYFSSNRPIDDSDSIPDFDIWKVTKEKDRWSEPIHLGDKVNSNKDEFYPSVTKSGNIYFTTTPEKGFGKEDIVMCPFINGEYMERKILDTAVNTKGYEFNAFVDPDEKYILFTSQQGRNDEMGGGDLYMSKKNSKGNWENAFNLGPSANSTGIDYCPFVSWDKKILFFASNRNTLTTKDSNSFKALIAQLTGPGNGFDDIYWVDISNLLR